MAFTPQATFRGSYFIAGSYFLVVGDTGPETIPAAWGSGDVHSGFPVLQDPLTYQGQGPQRDSACNTGFLAFGEGTDQRAWLTQLRQTSPKVLGTPAHSGPR